MASLVKQHPVAPLESGDPVTHRRQIAQRANAALVPAVTGLAVGQFLHWDGEAWVNAGEEGTWTPSLEFGGASTGITYTVLGGSYYKLGRIAYLIANLQLTSKGTATGDAVVTGIPFSMSDLAPGTEVEGLASCPFAINMSGLGGSGISVQFTRSSGFVLNEWGSTGREALTDANFTDTSSLRITALYITDA